MIDDDVPAQYEHFSSMSNSFANKMMGEIRWPPASNITFISLFRDRQRIVDKYFKQLEAVEWPFGRKYVVAVENDSKDKTRIKLENYKPKSFAKFVVGETTGEPYYGSVVHPERFRILSEAANVGLNFINEFLSTDYVVFLESDMIYDTNAFLKLRETVDQTNGLVAPMIWTERDKLFYDFWAYRHSEFDHFAATFKNHYHKFQSPLMVWSAGTCIMFKEEVVKRGARFVPTEEVNGAIVSFCRRAVKLGYPIHVNLDVDFYHPQ